MSNSPASSIPPGTRRTCGCRKKGIPFDPKGAVIYHCGPVIQDNKVIAAGPTTSARMNELSGFLHRQGCAGAHRERGHGGNGAGTAPGQGGLPRLHRGVCCPCILAHDPEGSLFRGPRHGRSGLGNRARPPARSWSGSMPTGTISSNACPDSTAAETAIQEVYSRETLP